MVKIINQQTKEKKINNGYHNRSTGCQENKELGESVETQENMLDANFVGASNFFFILSNNTLCD